MSQRIELTKISNNGKRKLIQIIRYSEKVNLLIILCIF